MYFIEVERFHFIISTRMAPSCKLSQMGRFLVYFTNVLTPVVWIGALGIASLNFSAHIFCLDYSQCNLKVQFESIMVY